MLPNAARQELLFNSVIGELRTLGYTGELLRKKYVFQDWFTSGQPLREAPAAAFGQTPVSYGTSCFVVVKGDDRPGAELVADYRALGAPIALEIRGDSVVQWKVTTSPSASDRRRTFKPNELTRVFADAKDEWSPSAILRAKNISAVGPRQIELDFGLIPSIESEIRARLDPLLREVLGGSEALWRAQKRPLDSADLFRLVFWFLAAKVLRDRGIDPFDQLSTTVNAREVLSEVASYYHEPAPAAPALVLEFIHQRLWSGFDFRNLSVEILALIYENTLVDGNLRDKHGIHATPASLARYIVNQLPFETFAQDQRTVLEPCCGHGTFLLAAMQRLRDLLPASMNSARRHDYFKRMLCGFELDPFSLEVSRLSLMLGDFPNQDGWRLYGGEKGDVFRSDRFPAEVKNANVVLCNPPFVHFSARERASLQTRSVNIPGELLHRVLDDLPSPGVIGFILPHKFLDGQEYRAVRRRLVERYDDILVVSLPDQGVFEQAQMETALVIGRHPKVRSGAVTVSHLKVDRKDWPRFRTRFKPSRTNEEKKSADEASVSLCVADLREIWQRLADGPTFEVASSRIARGIEWNVSLQENRQYLISSQPKSGFMRGLESQAEGFFAFQRPTTTHLCIQPKYRLYKAYDLPWHEPKVIVNAKRRRRGRWRVTAFADTSGLICYQTFTAVWPAAGWSSTVLAAILNGPVANCYIAAHDSTRDIKNEMLARIPVPVLSSIDLKSIDRLVQEYVTAVEQMPLMATSSTRTAADVLNEIDDLVIRAYHLAPSDEQAIRDYLRGADRPVPEQATIGGWWLQSGEKFRIEIRASAHAVLKALSQADHLAVLTALAKLEEGPRTPFLHIQKIHGAQELYVLRATDSLRVIFLARPDRTIQVQDVVNSEIVGRYFAEAIGE
jgi:hypothetical protein